MKDFNPKEKSQGLGDTIAKITNATGLDKVADAVAKASGAEDCGCNKRRKTLNELFPYTKKTKIKKPHTNTKPLNKIIGKYEVIQEIHCTLEGIGPTVLNKGMILDISRIHPLYNDVEHYLKNDIIKKL